MGMFENMGFNKQKKAGVRMNKKNADTTQSVLNEADQALQGDPLQEAVRKNKQKQ